jgi:hypothetical protein
MRTITRGLEKLYTEMVENNYHLVHCYTLNKYLLMNGSVVVRHPSIRLNVDALTLGLLNQVNVGGGVIWTVNDYMSAFCDLNGRIVQVNCKEVADKQLKLLHKVHKDHYLFETLKKAK